jgi:hypothetical protein
MRALVSRVRVQCLAHQGEEYVPMAIGTGARAASADGARVAKAWLKSPIERSIVV